MVWSNLEDIIGCLPKDVDPEGMASRCWNTIKVCINTDEKNATGVNVHSLIALLANARSADSKHTLPCSPEVLSELENSLVKLEDLLFPIIFILYERFKFFHRQRGLDETVNNFLNALDILAEMCEYSDIREERIKEQFLLHGALSQSLKQAIGSCSLSFMKKIVESFSEKEVNNKEITLQDDKLLKCHQDKGQSKTLRTNVEQSFGNKVNEIAKRNEQPIRRSSRIDLRAVKHIKLKTLLDGQKRTDFIAKTALNSSMNKNRLGRDRGHTQMLEFKTMEIKPHESDCVPSGKSQASDVLEVNQSKLNGKAGDSIKCIYNGCQSEHSQMKMLVPSSVQSDEIRVAAAELSKEVVKEDSKKCKYPLDCKSQAVSVFHCHKCSKIFSTKEMFDTHSETHWFPCLDCDQTFELQSSLSKHMLQHAETTHNLKNGAQTQKRGRCHEEFTCGECGVEVRGKRLFNKHMKDHTLYCDICNKVLDCRYTYKLHMDGHRGNKPYSCANCSRSFTRKSDLKAHIEVHDPERKKSHACDFCGKDFYRIHELNRHIQLHTRDKAHVCDICKKGYPTAHGLKCHHILHTGIKSFTCDKCGKSFAQRSNLVLHLMRHTGIKEHECPTCRVKFARKCYLESHMRTHSKEKPYTCDSCGACLSSLYSLQRHRRVHTGQKPHVCQICDKSFTWQSTYKKHKERHMKENLVKHSSMNDELVLHEEDMRAGHNSNTNCSSESN